MVQNCVYWLSWLKHHKNEHNFWNDSLSQTDVDVHPDMIKSSDKTQAQMIYPQDLFFESLLYRVVKGSKTRQKRDFHLFLLQWSPIRSSARLQQTYNVNFVNLLAFMLIKRFRDSV